VKDSASRSGRQLNSRCDPVQICTSCAKLALLFTLLLLGLNLRPPFFGCLSDFCFRCSGHDVLLFLPLASRFTAATHTTQELHRRTHSVQLLLCRIRLLLELRFFLLQGRQNVYESSRPGILSRPTRRVKVLPRWIGLLFDMPDHALAVLSAIERLFAAP